MDSDGEYYKQEIIEMVRNIKNINILNYIYIIISDIMKEERIDAK